MLGQNRTHIIDGFALELGDESLKASLIGLHTNSREELLHIRGGGVGFSADLEEQVGSNVTHLEKHPRLIVPWNMAGSAHFKFGWLVEVLGYGSHKSL